MLGLDWITGSFGVVTLVGFTVLIVTLTVTAWQDGQAARQLRHDVVRTDPWRLHRRG